MPSLGYQGGYTDPATGLVNMGARWYNPATGGFTSADTLGLAPQDATSGAAAAVGAAAAAVGAALGDPLAGGGPGPYGYATDNPLTTTDRTGHFLCLTESAECATAAPAAAAATAGCIASGVCIVVAGVVAIGAILVAGAFSDGPSSLFSCNCSGVSSLQGMNFSGLPDLSGLNFSGLPNLTGLRWPGFAGGTGPGFGGCGLACLGIVWPPPCDTACHQAQHVLDNENKVLAKPHENPAITQAQGDARRAAIEAKVKAEQASESVSGGKAFQGTTAPDTATAPTGNGGAGGNGPNLPASPGSCQPGGSGGPLHHLATNKNTVSTRNGGPWTPRFQAIFDKAGMTLNDPANLVQVPGHHGPHPELYHQTVFDRLNQATEGLNGEEYAQALRDELAAIGNEAQTPGSMINNLLTGEC
jgi:hypothetical protein